MQVATALSILGLAPGATKKQITTKFKEAALIHHPDKDLSGDPEAAAARFRRVKEAYDTLVAELAPSHVRSAEPNTKRRGPSGPSPQPFSTTVHSAAFASFTRQPATATATATATAASSSTRPASSRTHPSPPATGRVPKDSSNKSARGLSGKAPSRPRRDRPPQPERPQRQPHAQEPYWRHHIDRWGKSCGGCEECIHAAKIPERTRKKQAAFRQFGDISVKLDRTKKRKSSRGSSAMP
eukprot:m.29382 g.29382  ORF g.29382 m.29382 type:complete len:240 (+) comp12108_c0_seq1:134-853(+)